VCKIQLGQMSYGLNKTLQMYTVKIESRLCYKSSQVRVQVQVQQNGLKSGLESKSGLEYYKSASACYSLPFPSHKSVGGDTFVASAMPSLRASSPFGRYQIRLLRRWLQLRFDFVPTAVGHPRHNHSTT